MQIAEILHEIRCKLKAWQASAMQHSKESEGSTFDLLPIRRRYNYIIFLYLWLESHLIKNKLWCVLAIN